MAKIEKGLLYTEDHEWLKVDGEYGYVGLSDFAQHQLGDIVYIELPDVDEEYEIGESIGSVESVKTAADINIPVSGVVVEINEDLDAEPEKVNEDPYETWICKIKINDNAEVEDLMTDSQYEDFCEEA
ncbi:glycine cleavage system protein GcvH [Neofamilia massiliensis]|uniref:glycine cleavage system protein GcvH n=1 Tax=Neofamilia massiliensis TaxID=1673724 RepID=UPI0006BB97B9|nr:glycine cleavage system protein GcvH [Neofamilia massiliensis]